MNIRHLGILLLLLTLSARSQSPDTEKDTDQDGLSDSLEQSLLIQFLPAFQIAAADCANLPAEFEPNHPTPNAIAEDATLYGQVFPSKSSPTQNPTVEIHYYHLWSKDCGPHGHHLDTEHAAVLVRASSPDLATARWTALYWYAAAHEATVCDASQIARASTLHAEDHGATIWISPGKHASYLNETLCQHGCGADRCLNMVPLPPGKIINLGEPSHPMNGSVFLASHEWPLLTKMTSTNFPEPPLARLNALPTNDIAWFLPGNHPAQQVIAAGYNTGQAIALGGHDTDTAIALAGDHTGDALSTAQDSTGNALHKSYRHTRHALGLSADKVGNALHVTPKPDPPRPDTQ
jgi:hypothetical protein